MHRFVLAVSAGHLMLLPGYVKLGAINPWQAVGSLFGSGYLWTVMMLSAAAAPIVLGALVWGIDSLLRKLATPAIRRLRETAFVVLAIGSLLSLVNAVLLADRIVEQDIRNSLVALVNAHFLVVVTIAVIIASALIVMSLGFTAVRQRLVGFLRPLLYILAPSVLFSVIGVFYLLAVATPEENSGESLSGGVGPPPISGSPQSVVVLLFDALSYDVVFKDREVDERLPNLRALAQQSLVFHNVRSFPSHTIDNVPPLLTGQKYDGIKLDSQRREVGQIIGGKPIVLRAQKNVFDVAHERGYRVVVFGYSIRYCSTYVKDTGYCQSSAREDLNSEPYSLVSAISEVYRLAAAKTLPNSVSYRLESMVGSSFLSLIEERVLGIHNRLLPTLRDANGRFVYAHYPVPHVPYLRIDSDTGELRESDASYFDSLQVVDKLLGEVRQVLQESGLWEDSLIILVSDHNDAAATSDPRVPLMIKLPSMKQHLDYEGPWTHVQFLPLLEELFQLHSFEPDGLMAIVQELAPAE